MTRDRAKELLPVIQAFSEGKRIQHRSERSAGWVDLNPTSQILLLDSLAYRIAPGQEVSCGNTGGEWIKEGFTKQPLAQGAKAMLIYSDESGTPCPLGKGFSRWLEAQYGYMAIEAIPSGGGVERHSVLPQIRNARSRPADVSSGNSGDDPVNHPRHYNSCEAKCRKCGEPIEAIDVIEHFSLLRGTVLKYLWRAGLKGSALVDLLKARWFLDREIANLEAQEKP